MPRCSATKEDGSPCERIVGASQEYCYSHDPGRSGERQRNASRSGRSKGNPKLARLDKQLEDLAADTLERKVERGVAVAVNQIINSRLRAVEIERKIREQEELAERLEAIEDVLKRRTG